MRILAIDIGTGTQDILLFDTQREVENCLKMVMPAPTVRVAAAVRAATRRGSDVVLSGVMMGGGPSAWAVADHLKAGHRVYATPAAARTFDDDLERVAAMGVTLVAEEETHRLREPVVRLRLADFDYADIAAAFARFDVNLEHELDGMAIAVFDHGNAPRGVSDRLFRFQYLAERVRAENRLSAFAFDIERVPPAMTRMAAVAASVQRRDLPAVMMDTAPAAVLGALEDPSIRGRRPLLVVNVGNFHCLAFRLGEAGIEGVFEHHTGELTLPQLDDLLEQLAAGTLSHERVFEGNGHGALLFQPYAIPPELRHLAVVGPRRGLLRRSRLSPYFATPFGDMMLAGCYGLIRAYAEVLPQAAGAVQGALRGGRDLSLW